MNRKGFTFPEILMAATIGILIMASILSTFILIERNLNIGMVRTSLSALTRFNLTRVVMDIESATKVVIYDNINSPATNKVFQGNRIDITTYQFPNDPNNNTLVTKRYYLNNGNELWYDPDVSVAGNERMVVNNLLTPRYNFLFINNDIVQDTNSLNSAGAVRVYFNKQAGYREGGQFTIKLETQARVRNR